MAYSSKWCCPSLYMFMKSTPCVAMHSLSHAYSSESSTIVLTYLFIFYFYFFWTIFWWSLLCISLTIVIQLQQMTNTTCSTSTSFLVRDYVNSLFFFSPYSLRFRFRPFIHTFNKIRPCPAKKNDWEWAKFKPGPPERRACRLPPDLGVLLGMV